MTAPLRVTFTANRYLAYVSGPGARTILRQLRGRRPTWSTLHHAYAVTEATARDALAAAEARGWLVVASGRLAPPRVVEVVEDVPEPEEAGLW